MRPSHPTSNPAGHQLGSVSVIQIATPDPPSPVDDTPPHGGHIGPVHLSSSGVYHSGGLPSPRGAPHLWSCLTQCLYLSLRGPCIFSSTFTLRNTWWQVQWQPITLKQFCFQHDNEDGEWGGGGGQIMMVQWGCGALERTVRLCRPVCVYPRNWRVWNKTEMAGRGQLMGLSTQPTFLWVYCFSIIFCVCLCQAEYFWPCEHTCVSRDAWGPAPSSLKLNGHQPAVKLDCLSLSGGLSLLRWKEGEWSGPKALLVEAHFEAFNVWHILTHCQKHNDLQTAILSIKKVWQSLSKEATYSKS